MKQHSSKKQGKVQEVQSPPEEGLKRCPEIKKDDMGGRGKSTKRKGRESITEIEEEAKCQEGALRGVQNRGKY